MDVKVGVWVRVEVFDGVKVFVPVGDGNGVQDLVGV